MGPVLRAIAQGLRDERGYAPPEDQPDRWYIQNEAKTYDEELAGMTSQGTEETNVDRVGATESKRESLFGRRMRFGAFAIVGIAAATAASVLSGIRIAEGTSRTQALIPIAVFVGFGVVAIAMTRFDIYLAGAVAARASLDAAKLASNGSAPDLDVTGVFAVMFITFGVLWLVAQRPLRRSWSPMVAPFVVLIGLAALSVTFTPQVARGLRELSRLGAILVLLLVLQEFLATRSRQRLILGAVFVSAVVPITVAARQMATGSHLFSAGGFDRVTGTFTHPNPLATYLTLIVILGVAVLPHVGRWYRIGLVVLIGAGAWTLLLTYTRSGWIAVFIGLAVVGYYQRGILLPLLGIAVVVGALAVPIVVERFADLSDTATASGQPVNSLEWRVQTWENALGAVENPIVGMGLLSSDSLTDANKLPHNDFVRMYVELGIVGFLVYLWFLGAAWRIAVISLGASSLDLNRGLAVGFAGVAAAFLVLSVVSNLMSQLVLLWYFAITASLAWSTTVVAEEPADTPA
jgi:O-antigen ligase